MGNFDGCTKRGLGDPGVEIRTTIRPGKGGGVVVVEVLGSKQDRGGVSPRQASSFVFPHSLLPFLQPCFMRGGGKNEVP